MRNAGCTKGDRVMIRASEKIAMKRRFQQVYELGDMVWGKVKSHPWWPGQIFDEAFASPSVSETKKEGCLLVAFFGDDTFGWFNPTELIPFDPNFVEKSKQTNAKPFLDAVEDAEYEIRRRAALGLACCCQYPSSFRATGVKGCFAVDVDGYVPNAVYTRKQIEKARNGFQPIVMLCFLQRLALMPCGNTQNCVELIKNVAVVLAYRKVVFKKFDKILVQTFGMGAQHADDPVRFLDLQEEMPLLASPSAPPEVPASVVITKSSFRPREVKRDRHFNKRNVLRLQYPQQIKSLFSLSMNEKEAVLEAGDHVIWTEEAPADPLTPKYPHHQDDNRPFGSLTTFPIPGNTDKEDTTRNRRPEVEKINSTNSTVDWKQKPQSRLAEAAQNCCHLDNLDHVGNTFSVSGVVSGRKILARSERRDKKPRSSKFFEEELLSEKVIIVNERKRKEAIEFETGCENAHKHLKSIKEEASPRSKAGKSNKTVSICSADSLLHQPGEGIGDYCSVYKEMPSASKPPKKRLRPDDHDDYAMIGEINGNSCSKVDISMKGLKKPYSEVDMSMKEPKKPCKLKSLSSERRAANHNHPKYLVKEEKEIDVTSPRKLTKLIVNKSGNPENAAQPAKLVMQFPRQSALPSVPELKARFARFGPFHSAPCVSWKSSTCQIVFKCRYDAKAAYKYAFQNKSLFGNAKLTLEAPKSGKPVDETLQLMPVKNCDSTHLRSIPPLQQQQLVSSASQPKSCSVSLSLSPLTTGDKSSGGVQLMARNNIKNCHMKHSCGSSSSSHSITDFPGRNWPKVVPQPPPSSLPFHDQIPAQFVEACNTRHQIEARNNCINTDSSSPHVDISSQMLDLLTRCNEIICKLKCQLGHGPIRL
ncbi:hypothetical protein SLE2022_166010 [Rubroshorea leprosula]